MATNLLVLAASLFSIYCYLQFRDLRRNVVKAMESGFPYVIAPVYFQQLWWMILGPSISRFLHTLPRAWSEKWLPLSLFGRVWHAGYAPFALVRSDSFIIGSTSGNVLWTCDPDAILQFSRRHHDFVKPVEMLGMLNMYGPTVTGTEGEENRIYRRTAGPSFNDGTHGSVWTETLKQMLMLSQMWDHSEAFPITKFKAARQSYDEWKGYMEEMRADMGKKLVKHGPRNDMSLLESFVRAAQESLTYLDSPKLSPEAVLGNIFIFILAGYETSANTLNYAIYLLACHPDVQKLIQSDIGKILGDRPSSQWSFESDFPTLLDGFVGAVMNETLRLLSVLPFHPKTTRGSPVPLTLDGREYLVPADTLIMMNTSATHRNPKYWPSAVPKGGDGPPYPVSSFNPRQWLSSKPAQDGSTDSFSPTPGSWIPFSEGHRACMGKRFAQAEFCAVMASIFKDYSVELVTEDSGVDGREVKRSAWERARHLAEKELSDGVVF